MKANSTSFILIFTFLFAACQSNMEKNNTETVTSPKADYTSFEEEVAFLKKFTDVQVLEEPSGKGKILLAAALQGRVMTSTSDGDKGRSYGWINHELFESGDTLPHINVFGGEERFWLGPEGGQYSIFFKKGASFTLEDWQTPRLIDLDPFMLTEKTSQKAVYTKSAQLTNYSDYTFHFDINRSIEIINSADVFNRLGIEAIPNVKTIGYQTSNSLTNTGKEAWKKETGLLSIWLLGMFNPSPATTIVIPFIKGEEAQLGPIVNDDYFGKVPAERLKVGDGAIFFSGDGQFRSKIGLLPQRAKNICGAYDATSKTLTIVQYNKPEGVMDYVNSLWEIQDAPYKGDVINSYNDGAPSPGAKPLGPFYELETSSPALALAPGETGSHIQQTYHFEGEEAQLDQIATQLLGVGLDAIKAAF
jgi:hypothetical protein